MVRIDLDTVKEILQTLGRNKTRSFLTAFGIFWGIFMLLIVMGGARGMKSMLSKQFEGFATNSGFMGAGTTSMPYKGFQKGRNWDITFQDMDILKQRVKGIEVLASFMQNWGVKVYYQDKVFEDAGMQGITEEVAKIDAPQLRYGRFINATDNLQQRKVCVIGKNIYNRLFSEGTDPCGEKIRVNDTYYTVIGMNAKEGSFTIGGSASELIIIPQQTFRLQYNSGDNVGWLGYTIRRGYQVKEVEQQMATILREIHHLHPEDKQALMLFNAEVLFNAMDSLFGGIEVLGLMVGLGTLLAGAIGVSNILMITVKERTTEIGIRRAIGAKPQDIVFQILAESLVLTFLAGAIGISVSVLILSAMESGMSDPPFVPHFLISFWEAVASGLVLTLLGLLAGLAPAVRAMKIKPIDAMRDE